MYRARQNTIKKLAADYPSPFEDVQTRVSQHKAEVVDHGAWFRRVQLWRLIAAVVWSAALCIAVLSLYAAFLAPSSAPALGSWSSFLFIVVAVCAGIPLSVAYARMLEAKRDLPQHPYQYVLTALDGPGVRLLGAYFACVAVPLVAHALWTGMRTQLYAVCADDAEVLCMDVPVIHWLSYAVTLSVSLWVRSYAMELHFVSVPAMQKQRVFRLKQCVPETTLQALLVAFIAVVLYLPLPWLSTLPLARLVSWYHGSKVRVMAQVAWSHTAQQLAAGTVVSLLALLNYETVRVVLTHRVHFRSVARTLAALRHPSSLMAMLAWRHLERIAFYDPVARRQVYTAQNWKTIVDASVTVLDNCAIVLEDKLDRFATQSSYWALRQPSETEMFRMADNFKQMRAQKEQEGTPARKVPKVRLGRADEATLRPARPPVVSNTWLDWVLGTSSAYAYEDDLELTDMQEVMVGMNRPKSYGAASAGGHTSDGVSHDRDDDNDSVAGSRRQRPSATKGKVQLKTHKRSTKPSGLFYEPVTSTQEEQNAAEAAKKPTKKAKQTMVDKWVDEAKKTWRRFKSRHLHAGKAYMCKEALGDAERVGLVLRTVAKLAAEADDGEEVRCVQKSVQGCMESMVGVYLSIGSFQRSFCASGLSGGGATGLVRVGVSALYKQCQASLLQMIGRFRSEMRSMTFRAWAVGVLEELGGSR